MWKRPFRSPERVPEKLILDRHRYAIEGCELVRRAVEHTFGARAVVATNIDDQGVVEFAQGFDRLVYTPDFVVGIGEISPVHVSLPDEELLLVKTAGVPFRQ